MKPSIAQSIATVNRLSCCQWLIGVMSPLLLFASGCAPSAPTGELSEPPLAPPAKEVVDPIGETPSGVTAVGERQFGALTFQIPEGWELKTADSQFLLGDLRVPGEAGEARLTLSVARGGIEANFDRWQAQFSGPASSAGPREETLSVAGHDARLIDLSGTFSNPFQGQTIDDARLVGIAIPIGPEDNVYFCKLTGPQETVTANREKFLEFARSAK